MIPFSKLANPPAGKPDTRNPLYQNLRHDNLVQSNLNLVSPKPRADTVSARREAFSGKRENYLKKGYCADIVCAVVL